MTAEAARKASQLAKMQVELESLQQAKEEYSNLLSLINVEILAGASQVKVAILNLQFHNLVNLSHRVELKGIYFHKELGLNVAQTYIITELKKLGYQVVLRNISMPVHRIVGDAPSLFAGHELLISWG
jgi:hypothetical protein